MVSGSALDFAWSITDGSVFLCGLDMASASGLQYARPNALEEKATASCMKTYPNETKSSASRFASGSLELYRQWFQSLPKARVKNVYRFAHDYRFLNTLQGKMSRNGNDFTEFLGRILKGARSGANFVL